MPREDKSNEINSFAPSNEGDCIIKCKGETHSILFLIWFNFRGQVFIFSRINRIKINRLNFNLNGELVCQPTVATAAKPGPVF